METRTSVSRVLFQSPTRQAFKRCRTPLEKFGELGVPKLRESGCPLTALGCGDNTSSPFSRPKYLECHELLVEIEPARIDVVLQG